MLSGGTRGQAPVHRLPKNSPRTKGGWARLAALVMRLTQGLFDPSRVKLHCFVDDTIVFIRGKPCERKLAAAVMMLSWEAIGSNLAYRKGHLASRVDWIAGNLEFSASGISARVKESIVRDILQDLRSFEGLNVIPVKALRSFVGRANHVAGLLFVLRPFLHSIWGAFYGDSGGAPACGLNKSETYWAGSALFLREVRGVTRHFSLQESTASGPICEIGTDASP